MDGLFRNFIWFLLSVSIGKSYSVTPLRDRSDSYMNINILIAFTFISVMVFVIFFFISWSINKTLKIENYLLKKQNEIQYDNYLEMQQQELEIHKLYHDIGSHINIISILFQNGELDEAKEYTDNLLKEYHKVRRSYYCSNKIMNAVLLQKLKTCDENNIIYELDLKTPDQLSISDFDLMCLLTNLLDNAIEACQRSNSSEKKINISTGEFGGYFSLKVSNTKSSSDHIAKQGTKFNTSKNDPLAHGYGLKIIEDIILRYEGQKEFIDHGEVFSYTITFCKL